MPSKWEETTLAATLLHDDVPTMVLQLRGVPCLLALTPSAAQPFLMLTGREHLVGREAESVDLWVDDTRVSRRHARLRRQPEGWLLEDLDSSNGTAIGSVGLRAGDVALLQDGDLVRFGATQFVFIDLGGKYQALAQPVIHDAETGLLSARALRTELERRLRRRENAALVVMDLDGYSAFARHVGHVCAARCLQDLGRRLAESVGEGRAYRLSSDVLCGVLEPGDDSSTRIHAAYAAVLRAAHEDWNLPVSCASVELAALGFPPVDELMQWAEDKLLQAKLAGGDRHASSSVHPLWYRSDLVAVERWARTIGSPAMLVIGSAARTQDPSTATLVRTVIAQSIETLPDATEIAVAWANHRFLIAATCSLSELEAAFQRPQVRILGRSSRGEQVRIMLARMEADHSTVGLEWSLPFAQLAVPYHAATDGERWSTVIVAYERALQLATNLLLAALAAATAGGPDSVRGICTRVPKLLPTLEQGLMHRAGHDLRLGMGRWIRPLFHLARAVREMGWSLPSLERIDAKWRSSAHKARDLRNAVHDHSAPTTRADAAQFIYERVVELAEIFNQEEWALVRVDEVERIRFRRNAWRVRLKWLRHLLPADHPVEETDTELVRGTWVRVGGQAWVLASPLVDFDYSEETGRQVFFVANAIPADASVVTRVALDQRGTSTVPVTSDHVELRALIKLIDGDAEP